MLDRADYTKFMLALLAIVNPVGAMQLFVTMTARNRDDEKRHIARVAMRIMGLMLAVVTVELFASDMLA